MATESFGGGSGNSSVSVSSGAAGGGGTVGTGGCTATLSAGSSGSNWYNLNVAVAGATAWTATVNFVAPAVDFSTWNVNATFPSQYVMVVKPNGNGNNRGMTVTPNGQFAWPSVSCSTG
jgi:endo-1,4-beta-xylanase